MLERTPGNREKTVDAVPPGIKGPAGPKGARMRKTINGLKYDTDTAKYIGETGYGQPSDSAHWTESLYRKAKTGEYFLYGEGGPASRYAVETGQNEWSGGARITPMGWEAARKWAEEHLTGDDYEREFGKVEEDGEQVRLGLRVDRAAKALLDREASRTGLTLGQIVQRLVMDHLSGAAD